MKPLVRIRTLVTLQFLALAMNQAAAQTLDATECESITATRGLQWREIVPGWGRGGRLYPARVTQAAVPEHAFNDLLTPLARFLEMSYHPQLAGVSLTDRRILATPTGAVLHYHARRPGWLLDVNEDLDASVSACVNPPGRTPRSCKGPRVVLRIDSTEGLISSQARALVVDFCLIADPTRPEALQLSTHTWLLQTDRYNPRAEWVYATLSASLVSGAMDAYRAHQASLPGN